MTKSKKMRGREVSAPDISQSAAALGRLGGMKGGKSRSAAKVAAVRENGRKGGRPKGAKNKPKAETWTR